MDKASETQIPLMGAEATPEDLAQMQELAHKVGAIHFLKLFSQVIQIDSNVSGIDASGMVALDDFLTTAQGATTPAELLKASEKLQKDTPSLSQLMFTSGAGIMARRMRELGDYLVKNQVPVNEAKQMLYEYADRLETLSASPEPSTSVLS